MDGYVDGAEQVADCAQPAMETVTAPDPRSVLLCIRTPFGGIFRHVYDLADQLGRQGIAVGMVLGHDASLATDIDDERIKVSAPLGIWRLPISRAVGPGDLVNVAKVVRIARRLDVDLVHGHGAKGGAYARLAGRVLGIPSIYSPHGGSLHYSHRQMSGRIVLGLERLFLGLSGGIVVDTIASSDVFRAKVGEPQCPVAIIPNGLRESDFTPADVRKQRYDFAYFGRIIELKGVDVLLRAAARMQQIGRRCTIGIFGTGEDLSKFRALADSLTLTNVEWCGWAQTTRHALEAGRCLVVPSRFESMPYVVIEAAAMGVPMVASGVGGIPEILGPDHPVVPPNDVEALAKQLMAVLDNPLAAESRARRLRQTAFERFRIETMTERTLALYRTTMSQARRGASAEDGNGASARLRRRQA
jgi:glycosyltransferase involved in cell wall biosynthesis